MTANKPTVLGKKLRRILVVEDETTALHVLSRALHQWHFLVAGVASVREALEIAAQIDFDLAVVDLGLPDGSGEELIRELQRIRGPDPLPVIVLSGTVDPERTRSWSGVVAAVAKPYDMLALIELVKQHSGAPAGATSAAPVSAPDDATEVLDDIDRNRFR